MPRFAANLSFLFTEHPFLGRAGIRVMLEPLNTRHMPGFFVSRTPRWPAGLKGGNT